MTEDAFSLSLKDWRGGNSYVQGLNFHRSSGTFIGHRAVSVAGQSLEDIVFHQMAVDDKYLGSITVKNAGHGGSTGIEDVDSETVRCWIGHEGLDTSGYVEFAIGSTGTPEFVPVDLPRGDIEIDQPNNRLILRNGNGYRVYDFASVKAGERKKLSEFNIPSWGKRWQGMYLVEGSLFVHRDYATDEESHAHQFDLQGKLIADWDTTKMGNEAEGFLAIPDRDSTESVYAIKRVGSAGSKRTLKGTLLTVLSKTVKDPEVTIHSSGKVWTTSTRQVALELDAKFKRNDWTSTYPGHGEVYPSVKGLKGNDGRYAIDLMVSDKALGDRIAEYAWANRKRLGIRYVIWNRRIISETSSTPNRWVFYFNGNSSNPSKAHTNHVHISRYSNKGYTGNVPEDTTPDPAGNYPVPEDTTVYASKIKPGQKDSDSVYWVQRALREAGFEKALKTGNYDEDTEAAVKDFQLSLDDVADGKLTIGQITRLRGLAKTNWSIDYEGLKDEPVEKPPVVVIPPVPTETPFPGTSSFYIGANAPYVTLLGQRLIIHGWSGYLDGPGPTFTETDKDAVLWFQQKQGWTGASATGIPGPETWRRLMLNPAPVVKPPIQAAPAEETEQPNVPVGAPSGEVPPPVEEPPVVVIPPVVEPPKVDPPKPPAPKGIKQLIGVSFNAQWPGFKSTKAKSWSSRSAGLAKAVKAAKADVVLTQEMGATEAASFYSNMGKDWEYQRFGPLNTVGWNKTKLTYVKTLEVDTPDYGQFPGRGYLEAWLKDKDGNRLRLGSGHNPVKTAADGKYQESTIQQIVSSVNNEEDDWPLVWGMDTNNRASKTTGMWKVLKKYGYEWITTGIDAVFFNFGAVVTKEKVVDLGDNSDHNMLVFKIRTTKK